MPEEKNDYGKFALYGQQSDIILYSERILFFINTLFLGGNVFTSQEGIKVFIPSVLDILMLKTTDISNKFSGPSTTDISK